jgi:outer membrane protein assembly factor BamE (lipoprotein component of BamABCDE complex)
MSQDRPYRACGVVVASLALLCALAAGCGQQQPAPAPAPAPAPPAAAAPAAPPTAVPPAQGVAQLQIGMSGEQVQQIMGAPAQVKQEHAGTEWKYFTPTGGKIEVKLLNNRVTAIENK